MRIRLTTLCVALAAMFASASAFAQDCAPCAAASDISCPSCAPCASCTGASCELFGGLRSLLACRPCISCCTITPSCTPVCAAPAPCKVSVAPCGPIVAANIPRGAFDAACDSCSSCDSCGTICAPSCCGPMFPYLKPCLYNAIHRPINGVCKIVHGAFSALACATTPVDDCGFFKPAYVGDVTCGSCASCGPIDCAPAPCGACAATPACAPVAPACN